MSYKYFKSSDYAFATNADYIGDLYQRYLEDKNSVEKNWQDYFAQIGDVETEIKDDFTKIAWQEDEFAGALLKGDENSIKFRNLLSSFRKYGHYEADLDPLNLNEKLKHPALSSSRYNLDNNAKVSSSDPLLLRFQNKNSADFYQELQQIYSGKIAYEFSHIENEDELNWLYQEVEDYGLKLKEVTTEEKKEALNSLHRASSFEQLLHKKFPGAKRFSVEGGESSIASLDVIIKQAALAEVKAVELGMAHRGRLNVLTNITHKPYDEMIAEFRGSYPFPEGYNIAGDVKYHMGYSTDLEFSGNQVHVSLAFNPSHLEAVNPVLLGKVRAKQKLYNDSDRKQVLPVIIHGDAAIMGQGCVAECFNMAYTDGYNVGGTIHLIVNNQIGFTANPSDSRSTRYASDIAKSINCPIIHVNGESIEDVIFASKLALLYRQKFHKDIVIDLICFRKYGHNEGDEPNFTQPLMYSKIKKLSSIDIRYADELVNSKVIDQAWFDQLKTERSGILEEAYQKSENWSPSKLNAFSQEWQNFTVKDKAKKIDPATAISKARINRMLEKLVSYPEGFALNKKVAKQLELKKEAIKSGQNIDWSLGEALAYASLIDEDYAVRLSGQDAKRGTFSHRHSVFRDANNENEYAPLDNIAKETGKYEVYDSVLSEYAVLGFEYGYSLAHPNSLTIWEAQFGDFSNGAQIVFDQFIASGETKWMRASGVTMLLPHGYEGQGPEHSSARLERYLQACAEDNLQVANCTTPANFFHILRRQMLRDFRKPLVIMSPKSLLRHKSAVSNLDEFTAGNFQTIIADNDSKKVRKIVFCSGKIYYDLAEVKHELKKQDILIVRLEQLYPFPEAEIAQQISKYKNAELIWCQEEPENMGAWDFIVRQFANHLPKHNLKYIGRKEAASPATGYANIHKKEQTEIVNKALA